MIDIEKHLTEPGKTAHETMADDAVAIGALLAGTAIPNHRLVAALMNSAFVVSGRDALSREVYLGVLEMQVRLLKTGATGLDAILDGNVQ